MTVVQLWAVFAVEQRKGKVAGEFAGEVGAFVCAAVGVRYVDLGVWVSLWF